MTTYVALMLEFKDQLIAGLRNQVDVPTPNSIREIINLTHSSLVGNERTFMRYVIASDVARQTVTCSASGGVPGDTLVIGGTTLTNAASPASEDEFADAATDALLAASVVACINAHTTLSKYVWAAVTTSASGIFTIYCKFPGPVGNFVTLAETGSGFSLTGAVLASGDSDEMDEFCAGYSVAAAVAG